MRTLIGIASLAALPVLCGCQDLDHLSGGECGNGVVEAENREDCDRFPDSQCLPPGDPNECKLDCSSSDLSCPSGWSCGYDGICRRPAGHFQAEETLSVDSPIRISSADFDDDGRMDALTVSASATHVHFFDEDAQVEKSESIPSLPTMMTTGSLTTGDNYADMVWVGAGMTVVRGAADRNLLTTSYAPFALPPAGARALLIDAMPTDYKAAFDEEDYEGDEVIILSGDQMMKADPGLGTFISIPRSVDQMAGDAIVANLNEDPNTSPCEEVIVAYKGDSTVWVYSPCRHMGDHMGWNASQQSVVEHLDGVTLPAGVTVETGVILLDLNGDQHLDMMIGATPSGGMNGYHPEPADLYLAFGVGDGTFHSNYPINLTGPGDGKASMIPDSGLGGLPLAVGDVNSDGVVDFVTPQLLLVSVPGATATDPQYRVGAYIPDGFWDRAVIADFNANGIPDVVTSVEGSTGIEFYNGAGGGVFNSFTIPTEGEPGNFTVGDFDGDLVLDLAFSEEGTHDADAADIEGDSLSICFGQGFGAPEPPVSMGRFARIQQIAVGDIDDIIFDAMADLFVVSKSEDQSATQLAVLMGSSSRKMISPFIFPNKTVSGEALPLQAVVGQFDQDAEKHPDIAVISTDFMTEGSQDQEPAPVAGGGFGARLWMLPCTGEAAIETGEISYTEPLTQDFSGEASLAAAVDLHGDGIDEIVLLGESYAQTAYSGSLLVAYADGAQGARKWNPGAIQSLPYGFRWDVHIAYFGAMAGSGSGVVGGPGDPGMPPPMIGYEGKIQVVDVDGDDRQDVVALGQTMDYDSGTGTNHIVIFVNENTGTLDRHIAVKNPEGANPSSFTFIHADDDGIRELVYLTKGVSLLANIDLTTGEMYNIRRLGELKGGRDIAAADVNGDGIEDLLVLAEDTIRVLRGKAVGE